jgi:hypothetical protein
MGQAFHRKQIPVGSAPRTRGTGIKYVNVVSPAPRELTAEDIAARDEERRLKATLDEQQRERQRFHQENVNQIVYLAEWLLRGEGIERIVAEASDHGCIISSELTVAEAMKIVRAAAEQSCVNGEVSIEHFLKIMDGRAEKASLNMGYMDAALDHIITSFEEQAIGEPVRVNMTPEEFALVEHVQGVQRIK